MMAQAAMLAGLVLYATASPAQEEEEAQRLLEKPPEKALCDKYLHYQQRLKALAENGSALQRSLLNRMSGYVCRAGCKTCVAQQTENECKEVRKAPKSKDLYDELRAGSEKLRERCGRKDQDACRALPLWEKELVRRSILYLIELRDVYSTKTLDVAKTLAISKLSDLPIEDLLITIRRLLAGEQLSEEQLRSAIDVLSVLCKRGDRPAFDECAELGQYNLEAGTLVLLLQIVKEAYPETKELAEALTKRLGKISGAERTTALQGAIVAAFKEVVLTGGRFPQLRAAASSMEGTPLVRLVATENPSAKEEVVLREYQNNLMWALGWRTPVASPRTLEKKDADEANKHMDGLLGCREKKWVGCESVLGGLQECNQPRPGAFLLEWSRNGDGIVVEGEGWGRGDREECPRHAKLLPARLSLDKPELAGAAGLAAGLKAMRELIPGPPPTEPERKNGPPPPPRLPSSSAWYAAGFAGAPFLADRNASTASKVIPSALDGALLAAAAASAVLAIKYHNDFAAGRSSSLSTANGFLAASLACAGGVVLTRVASGLIYGFTDVWKERRSP